MARWDDETKLKALTMAEATSIAEASRQTGVPEGTIKRWRSENRTEPNRTEPNPVPKKIEAMAQEATARAVEAASEQIADRTAQVAESILALVEQAVNEIESAMKEGPKEKEFQSAWIRALVGVLGQGIEKHQLLTGQPTARQALEGQVTQRYEYEIEVTEQIVREAPDLIDRIFAPNTASVEGRGSQSAPFRLG